MRETAMARAREDPSTWRVTRARSDKAVEHRAEEIFREEWEREKRESKERVRVWEQERASKDSEDQRRRMIRVRLFYVGRVRVGA